MKCDRIVNLRVVVYADDAVLMEKDVEDMTTRLTTLADNSRSEVTVIKMDKTCSQHVHKRQCITVIENEMRAVEDTYKHKCDFCE